MDAHTLLADEASVDAARAYLPWIAGWGPVVALPLCAFAASVVGTTIATSVALDRRSLRSEVSWPERARGVFPARTGGRIMPFVASVPCLLVLPLFSGVLVRASYGLLAVLVGVAAMAGGLAARGRFERRIDARWSVGRSLVNVGAVVLIFVPQVLAAIVVILVGAEFSLIGSLRGAVVCGLAALIAAVLAMGGSLFLGRVVGVLRPAPARVREVVARMASVMGVPVPAVHVMRWSVANAIALPLHRAVVFTEGSLGVLSDEDIAGICAHELAHLTEPKVVLVGRVATAMAMAVAIAGGPIAAIALAPWGWMIPLSGLVVFVLGQRLLQPMETRADAAAREHEPSPGAYARALTRLYEANLMPVVLSAATSHPHLFDRLSSLGAPPPFPRPRPPSGWRLPVAVLAGTAGALGVVLVLLVAIARDGTSTAAIVLTGGGRAYLAERGYDRLADQPREAEALFRSCLAGGEDDGKCAAGLAASLSRQPGRCAGALRVAALAVEVTPGGAGSATWHTEWIRDARARCEGLAAD